MSLITLDGSVPAFLNNRRSTGSLTAARAGVQAGFAVIGYMGKAWHIKYRGEDTLIRNPRGQPVQELDVVIVGTASSISKNYFAKGYTAGSDSAPDCFSLDGLAPDPQSPNKQNNVCGTCPQNMWGSQMTPDGKKAKACRDGRRIAVVPSSDITNESMGGPMLLRLPPTTLLNYANYAEYLERKGVNDTTWVNTQLTFDPEFAYPRIVFTATGYVSEDQDREIDEVLKNPLIDRILYSLGPTESAPAAAVADDLAPIPGTPPKRATATVTALPRRASGTPEPPPEPEEEEEPDVSPVPEPAPAPAPEPPPPPAAGVRRSPFQAATRPPPAAPVLARRRALPTQPSPVSAPSDLENAIDDLLDSSA